MQWLKLYRSITKNPLWQDKPFSRGQAWIDLLLLANQTEGAVWKRGIAVPLQRGQVGWSQLALADRWGWSRGKVIRFLEYLESERQIVQQTVQQNKKLTTLISIVNFEKYQDSGTTEETTNEQQTDNRQYRKLEVREVKEKTIVEKRGAGGDQPALFVPPKVPKVNAPPYAEIIAYLNAATGKNYRPGEATNKLIRARWSEGFRVPDFQTVIDNKVAAWGDNEDMKQYLRPQTLFGTKFDSYLNENRTRAKTRQEELEEKLRMAL